MPWSLKNHTLCQTSGINANTQQKNGLLQHLWSQAGRMYQKISFLFTHCSIPGYQNVDVWNLWLWAVCSIAKDTVSIHAKLMMPSSYDSLIDHAFASTFSTLYGSPPSFMLPSVECQKNSLQSPAQNLWFSRIIWSSWHVIRSQGRHFRVQWQTPLFRILHSCYLIPNCLADCISSHTTKEWRAASPCWSFKEYRADKKISHCVYFTGGIPLLHNHRSRNDHLPPSFPSHLPVRRTTAHGTLAVYA